jgi:hypothetical protein
MEKEQRDAGRSLDLTMGGAERAPQIRYDIKNLQQHLWAPNRTYS